ncbi:NAD(P)H-hydrate dehydratase [Aurantimonas sp. HBX-1]|nr:NAD(P)H-hydrate dehydratase [Aurantimonas sp. HBX-1]UIJ74092.1 NAD(P)H-hydrate dehydratase [Aurantimonas sp. HBX-1]
MAEADRLTIDSGTAGIALMEKAGAAVAAAVQAEFADAARVAVLAGPGNNGGDAYVVARLLREAGRDVRLYGLVDPARLSGDAASAASAWKDATLPLEAFDPADAALVVDGLFGAGLARPVEGLAAAAIDRLNDAPTPVVAIDLPSGVSGESGKALGAAVAADLTVTFFRRKPGHLLEPGRSLCGRTLVADIGIAPTVLARIAPRTFVNEPALWASRFRSPADAGHKYDRGHAVVLSGGASQTGAARLAAAAALRAGAGLVTLFSPAAAMQVNASHLTAVMLKRCNDDAELTSLIEDERYNAFILGPGFGVGERARLFAAAILAKGRRLVLDADAISAFQETPDLLFAAAGEAAGRHSPAEPLLVLTPHEGEFRRLFPELAADGGQSKLDRARNAAAQSGAVVVLKGRDTVIAAPDGRAAINASGTPWLATAGTGDVLAGIVAAQLAQGMPSFEAACAGVWMHGRAAELFGPGLISENLPKMLPKVHAELQALLGRKD